MKFRNEWKHELSYIDFLTVRQRLGAVLERDPHVGEEGTYFIRSLYFDTPTDRALREKIDGVNEREKFRIRYYNGDMSSIKLEKKSKRKGMGTKYSAKLTKEEAQAIVDGDYEWMADSKRDLIVELYSKILSQGLEPKTIVDYTREPFIFDAGNVRVTLDYNIRTALRCTDFLDVDCATIQAGEFVVVLEVKWDEFLPQIVRDVVQLPNCRSTAFSKYQRCRIYD